MERGSICLREKLGCYCEVTHSHTRAHTRTHLSSLPDCFFPAASVSPLNEIMSGKGQKDEIETFPQQLCDYKSTNQTGGGQMGAELTEHPFCSTWWGLCLKDGRVQAGAAADLFQNEGRVTGL